MSGFVLAVGPDHDRQVPPGLTTRVTTEWATLAVDSRAHFIDQHTEPGLTVLLDGPVFGEQASSVAERYRSDPLRWSTGLRDEAAIVILDEPRRVAILRRDIIGMRPLLMARVGSTTLVSTSSALLLSNAAVDRRPDPLTVMEMLVGPLGHERRSVHRGVERLPAGASARIEASGDRSIQVDRPLTIQQQKVGLDDAVRETRSLFDRAVTDRVAGTSPIAVEVSGGLDSSTVAATVLSQRDALLGRIVYDDTGADERRYSDAVSDLLGVPLISAEPTIPTVEELDHWTQRLQHPVPPINGLMAIGLRERLAAAGAQTALSGLGGDDAFAAMPIGMRVVSAVQTRDRAEARRLTGWASNHLGETWSKLVRPTIAEVLRPNRPPPAEYLLDESGRELLRSLHRSQSDSSGVRAIDARVRPFFNGAMAAQLDNLALVDELTSVRLLHPFLDPSFIEFTHCVPPAWARVDGVDRSLQRRAFGDRLPPEVAGRTSKAEFSSTAWHFLEQPGLIDRITSGPLMDQPNIDADALRNLISNARQRQPGSVIPTDAAVRLDAWLRSAT